MQKNPILKFGVSGLIVCLALTSGVVYAQLKNVHQGTLKFQDDGVYLELALPASAFKQADTDNDKRLSAAEMTTHRAQIIKLITEQITLSSNLTSYTLKDILLTPIRARNSPLSPATRVVVHGKFELDSNPEDLQFSMGLFGNSADEQEITMRVFRPHEDFQPTFSLSPGANSSKLKFD